MTAAVNPVITHDRDLITNEAGEVEQDYNFLDYDFGDGWVARLYLDEPMAVGLRRTGSPPEPMLRYLRERFDVIRQLGCNGYRPIWKS